MAIESPLQAELKHLDLVVEAPFYIPATQTVTRPRRTLKYGDTFIVTDSHGDIGASSGDPDGLFHADTRFLSRLELSVNGEQPLLLGSNVRDDNTMLAVDLTNPDFYEGDRIALEKDIVHIARTIFLWRGTAYQRIALRNHGDRPIVIGLSLSFQADFADLFEVRGIERKRRGAGAGKVVAPDQVLLSYHGLDGAPRRTRLTFDPAPTTLATTAASYRVELAPHEAKPIFLVISCNEPSVQRPVPFLRGLLAAHRELRKASGGMTTVETSNELFNRRSLHVDDGHAAGPLSLCRDSLVLDDLRTRRADHRLADAVVRPEHGVRRIAPACGVPGQNQRSAGGCGAGQDPA
jgi:glycogen debranching enzyme